MATDIDDKHLNLIQGVLNRLAGNSFSLKSWSMTLVSALLALSAKDSAAWTVWIALLPAVTFWGLDGYFLCQERLFRKLYARVITPGCTVPPFSMETEPVTRRTWIDAISSWTLVLFHGTVLGAVILILLYQMVGAA